MSTKLTLTTLNKGVAEELFQRELALVRANIADMDTLATTTREITLTFKFRPSSDREGMTVAVHAASKMAKVMPHEQFCGITRLGDDEVEFYQLNPQESSLFNLPTNDEQPKIALVGSKK